MDHSLHIDEVNSNTYESERLALSDSHAASIGCLDFCNSEKMLLASGDWDGSLCVFDVSAAEENQKASKKSKRDNSASSTKVKPNNRSMVPQISLQAHASKISGVSWGNHKNKNDTGSSRIITGSWDHTLKLWDVERQDCLLTLNGSRVITSLDTSFHSENVVATGHPDCRIRLWDTRADVEGIAKVADTALSPSHKAWVSHVKWSESHAYELSSISHDGNIKIWDIRSSMPLHTVRTGNAKGLCLEYGGNEFLFAGGTSGIVHQYRCSDQELSSRQ
jgi:ribosome biogenesis protein YTM1